jgi:hypothetical protein
MVANKELDGRNGRKQGIVFLSVQRRMNRKEVCRWAFLTPLSFECVGRDVACTVYGLNLVRRC